ncbi:Uncharacterized protein Fot_34037 [Forsythia ovata]|uniref:Uncharacterized protein n=1 Tax=Forsythia ovata TaxID=205694 RepID=A0ABD1TCD8_9LAMI
MNDERLRDIVFKVRENELSGRYPFYLIHDEDKCLFFSGLEKKVEQEIEKLMNLHKYLHSNIENLDYGAASIFCDLKQHYAALSQKAACSCWPAVVTSVVAIPIGVGGLGVVRRDLEFWNLDMLDNGHTWDISK